MLLCDICDRGFHFYCLNPPLLAIPKEDWICNSCTLHKKYPKKTKKGRRKVVHVFDPHLTTQQIEIQIRLEELKKELSFNTSNYASAHCKKRIEKLAFHLITNSLQYRFTLPELKNLFSLQLSDPDLDSLRENNLSKSPSYVSIFKEGPLEVTPSKTAEHFDVILEALNQIVDELIHNLDQISSNSKSSEIKEKSNKKLKKYIKKDRKEIQNIETQEQLLSTTSNNINHTNTNNNNNLQTQQNSPTHSIPSPSSSISSPPPSSSPSPLITSSPVNINSISSNQNGWIFRIHSIHYDVLNSLQTSNKLIWFYFQNSQSNVTIQPGDTVFLWYSINLSDGKKNIFKHLFLTFFKKDGLVAKSTVQFPLCSIPEFPFMNQFRKLPNPIQSAQTRVILHIDQVLSKPISRRELIKNRYLSQLPLFLDPSPNFLLTPYQTEALNFLIQNNNKITTPKKPSPTPKKTYKKNKTPKSSTPISTTNSDLKTNNVLSTSTSSLEEENPTTPLVNSSPILAKESVTAPILSTSPSTLGKREPPVQSPKRGRPRKKPLIVVNGSSLPEEATNNSVSSPVLNGKTGSPKANSPIKLNHISTKCPVCGEEKQNKAFFQCILCNLFYHSDCVSSIPSSQNNNTNTLTPVSQISNNVKIEERICNNCNNFPTLCALCFKPESQNGEKLISCTCCQRFFHVSCLNSERQTDSSSKLGSICENCRLTPTEVFLVIFFFFF